jgi:hypothetical protein
MSLDLEPDRPAGSLRCWQMRPGLPGHGAQPATVPEGRRTPPLLALPIAGTRSVLDTEGVAERLVEPGPGVEVEVANWFCV